VKLGLLPHGKNVEQVFLRIFGPKREEVTGGWAKLYNKKLHNLYSSVNQTLLVSKSRWMRWAGNVACMDEMMSRKF